MMEKLLGMASWGYSFLDRGYQPLDQEDPKKLEEVLAFN